jgi:FlaA1/EpsC-like NDP-sugar epimerase
MGQPAIIVVQAARVAIDVALLAAALTLSFALRFDWTLPPDMVARLTLVMPYVVALQYGSMALFGAPRVSWRFISLRDLRPFIAAFVASGLVLTVVRYALPMVADTNDVAGYGIVPFSIIVLDAGLGLAFSVMARAMRRSILENVEHRNRLALSEPPGGNARTLLIGAGQAGLITAQELLRRPELGIIPVGFVDDDPAKSGITISGIRVLGKSSELGAIASRCGAREALITLANARGPDIRRLTLLCEAASLPVRIVPGIHEIVGGTVNLSLIREVAIEDLLGRQPIRLDQSTLMQALEGSHVLVTGAGGSIGSELCRQIARFRPATLYLLDSSENNLFNIHRELATSANVVPLVANVTDRSRMGAIFTETRPQIVFHAAAYKHVPMLEMNPSQGVFNNALGTRTVADLAHEHGSREFVLVSTDKAVHPSSVMGATKRASELYVQALGTRSATRFMTVRFGNVLGSAGSVVPIFKEQIKRGGPVTITDPRMTRYFMTIPEACQLILQAARLGTGGEIFMLDMGEPVKIMDLARDLISLSGFVPGVDIDIVVSGIRPGEKLTEELWSAEEGVTSTEHPSIFVGTSSLARPSWESVLAWFTRLEALRGRAGEDWVRPMLSELIPEATLGATLAMPSAPPTPDLSPQAAVGLRAFAPGE